MEKTHELEKIRAVLKRWLSMKTTETDDIDWLNNTPPMTSSYSPNETERERSDEISE